MQDQTIAVYMCCRINEKHTSLHSSLSVFLDFLRLTIEEEGIQLCYLDSAGQSTFAVEKAEKGMLYKHDIPTFFCFLLIFTWVIFMTNSMKQLPTCLDFCEQGIT